MVLAHVFASAAFWVSCWASPTPMDSTDFLTRLAREKVSAYFQESRVELTGPFRWVSGGLPVAIESVRFLSENGAGEALLEVRGDGKVSAAAVPFAAWRPVPIAIRRIQPGERLSKDAFSVQEVNVAAGMAHEYRGVILDNRQELESLEARQTILEGQFALATAIQRVPDVKRGDPVRLRLLGSGLTVSTPGIANEQAYLGGRVRASALGTKREIVGKLLPGSVVEVEL